MSHLDNSASSGRISKILFRDSWIKTRAKIQSHFLILYGYGYLHLIFPLWHNVFFLMWHVLFWNHTFTHTKNYKWSLIRVQSHSPCLFQNSLRQEVSVAEWCVNSVWSHFIFCHTSQPYLGKYYLSLSERKNTIVEKTRNT